MRDNHEGLVEIVDASQEGVHHFGVVRLARRSEQRRYRFSLSHGGYLALKRVLQMRPFDTLPGVQNRYYFVPSVQRLGGDRIMMTVRIEQGGDGKQVASEATEDVVANLMWFHELDDWSTAENLRVVA